VTCLEMLERPALRPDPPTQNVEVVRCEGPDLAWYRNLFRRIGAPYLWFSRLELDDEALSNTLCGPDVELYVLRRDGDDIGMMELDFTPGECELRFFGLVESAIGTGGGRRLMNCAIERAWGRGIRRFHLRTATLDRAGALAFYERSGFRPYKREVEICDDPRVAGLLPADAAPGMPVLALLGEDLMHQ
jgi:GNAT superfamily N-acetyltransferase